MFVFVWFYTRNGNNHKTLLAPGFSKNNLTVLYSVVNWGIEIVSCW